MFIVSTRYHVLNLKIGDKFRFGVIHYNNRTWIQHENELCKSHNCFSEYMLNLVQNRKMCLLFNYLIR